VRSGALPAEDEKKVASELRKQGLVPLYIGLSPSKKARELKLPKFNFGKRRDILFFTQEISTLLNAGVPLDRALTITAELSEREEFRNVVNDVLRTLKGGKSFADSLAARPDYFADIYVNMVRAGEASGSLQSIFERLSEYEKTRDELRLCHEFDGVSSAPDACRLRLHFCAAVLRRAEVRHGVCRFQRESTANDAVHDRPLLGGADLRSVGTARAPDRGDRVSLLHPE
jgi:hypothetical protein